MSEEQYIVQTPKVAVKLIRNTRGYNWEITVRDDYSHLVTRQIEELDKEMRQKYGDKDSSS